MGTFRDLVDYVGTLEPSQDVISDLAAPLFLKLSPRPFGDCKLKPSDLFETSF